MQMTDLGDLDRIIEMAWEDRTPFEAIETLYGLRQDDVIALMRRELKPRSFKVWRARTRGRKTKHQALRSEDVMRSHCKTQYKIKSAKK
nr:TIGR03643 family protein [Salinivibrio socompensis]